MVMPRPTVELMFNVPPTRSRRSRIPETEMSVPHGLTGGRRDIEPTSIVDDAEREPIGLMVQGDTDILSARVLDRVHCNTSRTTR